MQLKGKRRKKGDRSACKGKKRHRGETPVKKK